MDHVPLQLVFAHKGLGADEAAGGVLYGGEGLGEYLVERSLLVGGGGDPRASTRSLDSSRPSQTDGCMIGASRCSSGSQP
eukprot:gene69103-94699_t